MRASILLLAIVSTATLTSSAAQPTTPSIQAAEEVAAQPAASELQGEVIAVDAEKKTLKLKAETGGDSPAELELAVEAEALTVLPELKAGEQVTVVCREGTSGDKCLVTAIKKAEPK